MTQLRISKEIDLKYLSNNTLMPAILQRWFLEVYFAPLNEPYFPISYIKWYESIYYVLAWLVNFLTTLLWGISSPMIKKINCILDRVVPFYIRNRKIWLIQRSKINLQKSPPFAFKFSQHQGLFQWVGSSHQVAKALVLQQQYFQWIFRVDFL